MSAPDQGLAGQSYNAAQKIALIQAKIGASTGYDAVETLMNELRNALEEVEKRRTIEATLQQQIHDLEGEAFSPRTEMALKNSDHANHCTRVESIENLTMLHIDFTKALRALETANPGVDTSELATVALRLQGLTERIDQSRALLDGSALLASGTCLDHHIPRSNLQMAEDNSVSGQNLIDRIKNLETCSGCSENNWRKRKRCDCDHTIINPEFPQNLIRRLNDETPPQPDLRANGMDLLSALRTSVENPAQGSLSRDSQPSTSEQQYSSSSQPDIAMGSTGVPRSGDGDDDCPKQLEKMRKQLEDALAQFNDKGWEVDQLQTELEKMKYNRRDCEWNEKNVSVPEINRLQTEIKRLESEIENLRAQIATLTVQIPANDPDTQDRLKEKDIEIEQLLNDRDKANRNYHLCMENRENVLDPEIRKLRAHVKGLKKAIQVEDVPTSMIKASNYNLLVTQIDNLQEMLRICEHLRDLERISREGGADKDEVELANQEKLESFDKEDLLQQLQLQNKMINTLRGDLDALHSKLKKQQGLQAEVHKLTDLIERLNTIHEQRLQNNVEVLAKVHEDHEIELFKCKDRLETTQNDMDRQRDDINNLKRRLRDCQELRKKVADLGIKNPEEPDDLEGLDSQRLIQEIIDLQRKWKACGIALIDCEEARERDRHYIPSDEELDEDLVDQNQNDEARRNQIVQDLEAEVLRLKKALSDCQGNESARNQALQDRIITMENDAFQKEAAYQKTIENPEDAVSIDFLKQRILNLRGEAKDAKAKLRDCEANENFLTKPLEDQVEAMEKGLEQEKEHTNGPGQQAQQIDYVNARFQQSQEEIERLEAQLAATNPVPESLQSLTEQVRKLKQELSDRIAHNLSVTSWIGWTERLRADLHALEKENTDLKEEIENLKKDRTQNDEADILRAERDRLRQELVNQRQNCEIEKETLRQDVQHLQGKTATPERNDSADILKLQEQIKSLQEQVAKKENDLREEVKTSGTLRNTMNKQHAALEKERLASAKCNEKLAALRAQYPGSGFGNPTKVSWPANEEPPEKENCVECWAEVAKLQHLIANLEVEKTNLSNQIKEVTDNLTKTTREGHEIINDGCWAEVVRLKKLIAKFEDEKTSLAKQVQKLTELNDELLSQITQDSEQSNDACWAEFARVKQLIANLEIEKTSLAKQLQEHKNVNAELTGHFMQGSEGSVDDDNDGDKTHNPAKRPLPRGCNDFHPHNAACSVEIEALNNHITSLKQRSNALEQQVTLDRSEIDALKENNTNKTEAYKKFVALVEKLRAELEGLQVRLAECAGETWQERRARMRHLAAANRGPRSLTNHRMDPALAQVEEWKKNGWWGSERPAQKRRKAD